MSSKQPRNPIEQESLVKPKQIDDVGFVPIDDTYLEIRSDFKKVKTERKIDRYSDLESIIAESDINRSLFSTVVGYIESLSTKPKTRSNGLPVSIAPIADGSDTTPAIIMYCSDSDSLVTGLINMFGYANPMRSYYKEVLVVTRKWDSKAYKQVEEYIFEMARYQNIKICFVLETDYSFVKVPFL